MPSLTAYLYGYPILEKRKKKGKNGIIRKEKETRGDEKRKKKNIATNLWKSDETTDVRWCVTHGYTGTILISANDKQSDI